LLSRYDPAAMTRLIQDVEWMSDVFRVNLGFDPPASGRTVLFYLPDSPYEYEQLIPTSNAEAYYLGAPWRNTIVMRTFANARHVALHEFTHLMLRHVGSPIPAWYNEGTAEYYATARPGKDGTPEAGFPDPGHRI
jgi:hypothetical protein